MVLFLENEVRDDDVATWSMGMVPLHANVDISDNFHCHCNPFFPGERAFTVRLLSGSQKKGNSARGILDRRYANGEINQEEYLRIKKDLE